MKKANEQTSAMKAEVYDLDGSQLDESQYPDNDVDAALDADRLKRRWRVLRILGWVMVAVVIAMLAMVALFEMPEETSGAGGDAPSDITADHG